MKILIVRTYPNKLDINSYNSQEVGLAKAFYNQGHICDIVLYDTYNHQEKIMYKNNIINIYYFKGKKILRNCFFDKQVFNIINNYDVVQVSEYDQIFNSIIYKKFPNKTYVYHGPYKSNYTKKYNIKCLISDIFYQFNRDFYNVPCIAKSELAYEFLKSKGFKNIKTVGVGIDTSRFPKIKERKYNKDSIFELLYIGKIEKRRNVIFILSILKELIKENQQYNLTIIGNGPQKYKNKCLNYINKNNLEKYIKIIEKVQQDRLPEYYSKADCFLLASEYEIFGMVMLEAMFFGIPIITTTNGGQSVLINNGETGFVVKKNVNDWCNAIKDIKKQSKTISANEKKLIKNKFTWDKLVNKFISIYVGENNEN